MASIPEDVPEMPDLTGHLRDHGLYSEYLKYVKECRKHRAKLTHSMSFQPSPLHASGGTSVALSSSTGSEGHGAGAAPLTRRAPIRHSLSLSFHNRGESNPAHFEEYYPTHRKFMWHHTASYWTAVLFVQGSLLFTFSAGIEVFEERLEWRHESIRVMTLWPNFVGSLMFMVGAYCSYLNLINLKKEPNEPIEYFLANWQRVRENHSEVTSRVGTMAYFFGANIFTVGAIFPFCNLQGFGKFILVTVPGVVGSVCFVVGGVCEVIHNGVTLPCSVQAEEEEEVMGHRSTYRDPAWWIAILNTVGGVMFLVACLPGLFFMQNESAKMFGKVNMFVGSGIFIATSWLLVVMWKSNDFGLALIRQLNDAIGSGAPVARRRREAGAHVVQIELQHQVSSLDSSAGQNTMSLRGAVFIGIYSWLSFMAIINVLCLFLWNEHTAFGKEHVIRDVSEGFAQIVLVLAVLLVLGLHSTVTSVPKEEPYRFLVFASRLVLTVGAVGQTLSFLDFLWVPFDDEPKGVFA